MLLRNPTSSVSSLLYFCLSADSGSLAGNRRALRTATSCKRVSFPILALPKIRAGWPVAPAAPGSSGKACGLRPPRCLCTASSGARLFSSHCVAAQPSGVNKLSGLGSHRRREQTVFRPFSLPTGAGAWTLLIHMKAGSLCPPPPLQILARLPFQGNIESENIL